MDREKRRPIRDAGYRKGQNRLAQQRFRAKQKQRIAQLEHDVANVSNPHHVARTDERAPSTAAVKDKIAKLTPRITSTSENVSSSLPNSIFNRTQPLSSPISKTKQDVMGQDTQIINTFDFICTQQIASDNLQFEISSIRHPGNPKLQVAVDTNGSLPNPVSSASDAVDFGDNDFLSALYDENREFLENMINSPTFDVFDQLQRPNPSSQLSAAAKSFGTPSYVRQHSKNNQLFSTLPSPRVNHLRMLEVNLVAACLENARQMGVAADQAIIPEFPSPFRPLGETSDRDISLFSKLNPDLRPCHEQFTFPHPFWIDTLPIPVLRVAMIKNQHIIDVEKVGYDINEGGIICWGCEASNAGLGVPWDMRSWEVRPWFLMKWRDRGLFAGVDGVVEMQEAMKWWGQMRGDSENGV